MASRVNRTEFPVRFIIGHRQCWTVDSYDTEPIEYQDAPLSTNFQPLANFIWSVADLLRGPYRPPQYEPVMLPLTVPTALDQESRAVFVANNTDLVFK